MPRLLSFVLVLGTVPLWAAPAPKAPSLEEVRKAISDLGSPRFAVREKASKFLWEAGATAEPLLQEAASDKDEETASRAKAILEKFSWGLYPDTPPDVTKIIEKFRGGEADVRRAALGDLLQRKPPHFSVLRKLIQKEPNEEARQEMFARLAFQARGAVPEMLLNKRLEEAAELLDICLATKRTESFTDFATFQVLRGRLPETIAQYEKLRQATGGEEAARHATTLAYLYRAKKDWKNALSAAVAANDGTLYDAVAWEAGNWSALLDEKAQKLSNPAEEPELGAKAAYARLAGNKAKYDEIIGQLRKELNAVEGDDSTAFVLSHALLLNGEGAEAVSVLQERYKRAGGQVFDLLCAQLKFKEAFALAAKAEAELAKEPDAEIELRQLRLRKARTLGMLGDKDGATQLFRQELDKLKNAGAGRGPRSDFIVYLRDFIEEMVRGNMRDLAMETLAAHFPEPGRNYVGELFPVLEPLFDDKATAVVAMWRVYRKEQPKEEPSVTLKRISAILAGKAERKEVDQLAQLFDKKPKGSDAPKFADPLVDDLDAIDDPRHDLFALAEAYHAINVHEKAGEYYQKAADAPPAPFSTPRFEPGFELGDENVDLLGRRVVPHRLQYADFLLAQKKYAEAATYYHKAWQANPSNALALFLEGQAKKLAGDKDGDRLQEFARWIPLGNEDARAHFCDELSKRGFHTEAQREMRFLLETGWFRSYQVGNIYLRMGRRLARQKDYATAAAYHEKDVVSLFRTGAVFREERALLTVPELARTFRIRALLAAGKDTEAQAEIQQGLKTLPGNVDLALGVVPDLDRMGKKKEAEALYTSVKQTYEAALKEFGNSPELRNGLAWTMVNCRRDLDDALKHAEKAVSLAPKTAGYIDTLAEVHFRKKNKDKALELMRQCVVLDPKNPYYRKQLERFAKGDFDSPTPDEETGED